MATKTATTRKAATKKRTDKTKKDSAATSISLSIFDTKGKETGTIELPAALFGLSWNADLVHQVVTSMQANARTPVAHTKDRGEVRGGGRKPWKQKGTGRARHGSTRSPIWVGGGIAHGPRNDKSYAKKINKGARRKALFVVLSQKLRDGEILFTESLGLKEPKTAKAKEIMVALSKVKGFEALSRKRTNVALFATSARDKGANLSFRNFGNVDVTDVANLNPVKVLKSKYLIITEPKEALEVLKARAA